MLGVGMPLPNTPVVDNAVWVALLVVAIIAVVGFVYGWIVSRSVKKPMAKVEPITQRYQERKAA